jgi:CubicO group peptidase (beta-lactamase class C family)
MSRFAGIDGLLTQAADAGAVPGVVALVTGPDGVLYEGVAGDATPDTMFRFASMTKAMATVAALALVDEGRLELDQPVSSVLPEFGELQVLEGFDGDTPRLRPPATPATIRHLMTHTAGHGYWFGNEELVRYHAATGVPNAFSGLRASLHTPLLFDPGTAWNYGINTDWLGQVVEKLEGKGLDAVLAERLWKPLGMTDTTFTPTEEQKARLMPVYQRQADGSLAPSPHDIPAEPEYWAAGHGSYGTGRDYARFVAMLLAGGGSVLRPETVELAFADHLGGVALPESTPSTEPELVNAFDALPFPQTWGLGFHITSVDLDGMRRAGTGDWAGLFNSFFWVDRTSGIGAVLLTQVLPFFDARVIELLVGFEQAVYAAVGEPAAA